MREQHRITQLIQQAIADGVAPAIAFSVEHRGQRTTWYAGQHGPGLHEPATSATTRFDLASLTKPLTTALWALRLASDGRLDLTAPIGHYLTVQPVPLRQAPVWRLLNHTSGLPAHRPYFEGLGPQVLRSGDHAGARRTIQRMVCNTTLESAPGTQERYSDLGYLLLAWICESVDAPLAAVWPSLPGHGPDALHFTPSADNGRYAATEQCPWRRALLRGQVHDDNCWVLGGVEGHAGLFGTLDAVADAGRNWLDAIRGVRPLPGVAPSVLAHSVSVHRMHPRGTHVLGWDTPTPGRSTAGQFLGRHAIGHLGFTGTSLWIDPDAELVMTLLTNRVCPSRNNQAHRPFRPRIHDAGWRFAHAA